MYIGIVKVMCLSLTGPRGRRHSLIKTLEKYDTLVKDNVLWFYLLPRFLSSMRPTDRDNAI